MRYFFDVANGGEAEDEEGIECASDEAAIAEAGRAASQMSADITGGGSLSVTVREGAETLAVVTVSIAIDRRRANKSGFP